MKITIAAIGRAGRGPERDLYEHYAGRIRWPLALRELEEKKKLPTAQLVEREGELLLAAVPPKATLVALDRRGKPLDSEAFARQIGRWRAMRRHVAQLQNACFAGDWTCRPRQRQALLQWAYDSRML